MAKILIQFAHPALEKSRIHATLIRTIKGMPGVTINDLYEMYPDLNIDADREQALLLQHDIIIFQHPVYWYSAPAIIKQWQDLVLEHGWAYGHTGKALLGKWTANAVSMGGQKEAYLPTGHHGYTLNEFLLPFRQTARLCNMTYMPPFVIYGTHRMRREDIPFCCQHYGDILQGLRDGKFTPDAILNANALNDLL